MLTRLDCTQKVVYRLLSNHGLSYLDLREWLREESGLIHYDQISNFYSLPLWSTTVSTSFTTQSSSINHKVVSVRPGPVQDTYDLTVADTENFALTAGVFVHNSKDLSDSIAGTVGVLQRGEGPEIYEMIEDDNE